MSELRIFSFNYAPQGWAQCNGQFLPINQNQALFSLLGTTYGGNGQTTFALPDLRDKVPMHIGQGLTQGQAGGENTHTLTQQELPQHVHFAQGTNSVGDQLVPTGQALANPSLNAYTKVSPNAVSLVPATISNVGGSQAHENRTPFLGLNICIALQGIFPSRN